MAQLDASIILGAKPMQIESPVNQLAKVLQIKDMQQAGDMRAMQMQDAQTARDKQNRLQALLAQGGTTAESLMRGGFLSEGQDFAKSQSENAKRTSEAEAKNFEIATKRFSAYRQTLGSLASRPDLSKDMVLQAGQQLVSMGIMTPELYQKAVDGMPEDVNQLRQKLQQGVAAELTPEQLMTAFAPKPQEINNGQKISFRDMNPNSPTYGNDTGGAPVQRQMTPGEVASNKVAQENLSVAQGNLGVARERLTFDQNQPKGVLDTERGLLVDPRTGEARSVTMGGKPVGMGSKPLNEGQGKANLFGTRMEEANRILNDLEGKYSPLAVNAKMAAGNAPLIGGAAGYAGNTMLSNEGQKAEQAQRDFINAVLRRESGAVINPDEFQNGQKQYFPQPGDTKGVLDQKRRNRELAIEGIRAEVPGGFRTSPSPASGQFKILSVE